MGKLLRTLSKPGKNSASTSPRVNTTTDAPGSLAGDSPGDSAANSPAVQDIAALTAQAAAAPIGQVTASLPTSLLPSPSSPPSLDVAAAEATLQALAGVFFKNQAEHQAFGSRVSLGSPPSPGSQPFVARADSSAGFTDEARYRALVEQLPAVVFMASLEQGIGDAYVSPQIEATLGYSQDEWLQDPLRWYEHIHPDDKARWSTEAAEMFLSGTTLKSAYRVIARDGRVVWFQCEARMIRTEDGRPWAIHGVAFDVTDLKNTEQALLQAQDRLMHGAFHDALTNLPNRALFLDRLERAIARAKRHKDYKFAVLFIDIDRFKIVNDSLGHHGGDELIVQVAQRILQCLRLVDVVSRPAAPDPDYAVKDDTLARIGGDEFTILLDDIRAPRDAVRVAERIQASFAQPFVIGGQDVFSTVSIGIAASSIHASATDFLRDADTAMYRAKSRGRARCEIFDPEMHERAIDRLKLETALRRAFDREEFRVYYQPIVSLRTGAIAGFEALMRWDRPGVGIVGPGEFIAITEEMGLILPLGLWVFRKACEQARRWHTEYPRQPRLTMSVNISGRQFAQSELVAELAAILKQTKVDPTSVKLEITESVAMDDAERTIRVVKQLKKLGLRISIDDFGTGFSSLSYLRRFPIDTLKIDRSFVSNSEGNSDNREIVRTIIGLARNLGMDVVAEGTETQEEVCYLKSLTCDYAQGYLFSRPLDGERAQALVAEKRAFDLHPVETTTQGRR
jgi:PAS domain S-box-containing protein